jgi:hypothetical protein
VVKNYLRKVYDKLGVADRLELALYCLNSRVLQDAKQAAPAEPQSAAQQAPQAPEAKDQTTTETVADPLAEKKNS